MPARLTRPTFAPPFVTLGAAEDKLPANTVIDGCWHGPSKRSCKIG